MPSETVAPCPVTLNGHSVNPLKVHPPAAVGGAERRMRRCRKKKEKVRTREEDLERRRVITAGDQQSQKAGLARVMIKSPNKFVISIGANKCLRPVLVTHTCKAKLSTQTPCEQADIMKNGAIGMRHFKPYGTRITCAFLLHLRPKLSISANKSYIGPVSSEMFLRCVFFNCWKRRVFYALSAAVPPCAKS